ncbi:hypothetical protein [Cupriavidus sp. 8B]
MMFEGRSYKQTGYKGRAIRFADLDSGVATTAYSYAMSNEERDAMARRITAALNFTRNLTVEDMEAAFYKGDA